MSIGMGEFDTTDAGIAYLGAVLGSNGKVLDESTLNADDFSNPMHGRVFEAAKGLRNQNRPVGLVTLGDALPKSFEAVLNEALQYTHLTYNAEAYAEIIEKHSVRRRVVEAGQSIAALDPSMEASEMVDRAQAIVAELADRAVKPSFQFIREMVDEVLVNAVEGNGNFIPSPWRALNVAIGGFRPGAVYIVAARPGVGKSVVATQIATALSSVGVVAFASLEMSGRELTHRFISERSQVNVGRLNDAKLSEWDIDRIAQHRNLIDSLNIAVDERTSVKPGDVRAFARTLSRKQPLAGIVVDYLQLMASDSRNDRVAQVTEFSRQMKVMAKDFDVPVIVLSQLNRESEKRADGRPRISDLRESGAIEQDADVILLLSREGEDPQERLIIDVAKNRHGNTPEVELDWQGVYSRAVDLD
ncbi:AAA family ATPase [Leucobacter allii]|uniref:DNA 5'-3' helicase n=1 Tax=Leucobacter allii TaxID=2932247 RepID=A0ABY4FJ55_9MICO|nr:DnaB-like helicase C-terminal domain-containing protein [Leucobacter allii]UOQ56058.1 AAA family ATPase [Leucobacter allii]